MGTRERILEIARKHFNQHGCMEQSMRSIASACGITLSNLQYHYKTREKLIEAIFDEMSGVFNPRPGFDLHSDDLQLLLDMNAMVFEFQKKYLFYFSEISALLRAFPAIRKKNLQIKKKRIQEYITLFKGYETAGYFKREPWPGYFAVQAETLWFMGNFYLLSQLSDGKKHNHETFEELNKLSINLIYSMFTEKGIAEMTRIMQNKV